MKKRNSEMIRATFESRSSGADLKDQGLRVLAQVIARCHMERSGALGINTADPGTEPVEEKVKKLNHREAQRRPGRPKAVPDHLIPKVVSLYRTGLGYRAVAHELRSEGVSADWSTIRRIIKAHTTENPEKELSDDL